MFISKTPLRISFVGGSSDIIRKGMKRPGRVISTTINKYIYVIINKRYDNNFRISYSENEFVNNVKKIRHDHIREVLLLKNIRHGIEVVTIADIPSSGSGLGSSSALTVGLLKVLNSYLNIKQSKYQLAMDAYKIEKKILKKTLGYQDHFNAVFGGLRRYIFYKSNKVKNKKIADKNITKLFKDNILLFHSGINRSAEKILKKIKKKKNNIFIDSLAKLTFEFEKELEIMNIKKISYLLDKNWEIKKKLSEDITNKNIDNIYNSAKKNGALGGKILGAGGGGYLLFLCYKSKRDKIIKSLKKLAEHVSIKYESEGTKIILKK
jgi:D-glycero-alpha-D-manno-heptose-7-phosphate kinase